MATYISAEHPCFAATAHLKTADLPAPMSKPSIDCNHVTVFSATPATKPLTVYFEYVACGGADVDVVIFIDGRIRVSLRYKAPTQDPIGLYTIKGDLSKILTQLNGVSSLSTMLARGVSDSVSHKASLDHWSVAMGSVQVRFSIHVKKSSLADVTGKTYLDDANDISATRTKDCEILPDQVMWFQLEERLTYEEATQASLSTFKPRAPVSATLTLLFRSAQALSGMQLRDPKVDLGKLLNDAMNPTPQTDRTLAEPAEQLPESSRANTPDANSAATNSTNTAASTTSPNRGSSTSAPSTSAPSQPHNSTNTAASTTSSNRSKANDGASQVPTPVSDRHARIKHAAAVEKRKMLDASKKYFAHRKELADLHETELRELAATVKAKENEIRQLASEVDAPLQASAREGHELEERLKKAKQEHAHVSAVAEAKKNTLEQRQEDLANVHAAIGPKAAKAKKSWAKVKRLQEQLQKQEQQTESSDDTDS